MKRILLFSVVFFQSFAFSQTKLISHKSHSGSATTFRTALEHNLFDIGDSNFGDVPFRLVKNAQLDTIIFLTDEKTVMVTSEYCERGVRIRLKEEEKADLGEFWKAGKDTLVSHPLFSKKHSLDSIKNVLKEEYHFKNDIDNVVFIGYDNEIPKYEKEKKKKRKKNTIPPVSYDNNNIKPFLIFVLAVVSVLLAFLSYRINRFKKVIHS
ncbi:MAG: hypothetical protein RBR78_10540 [Flavobacteriaceae bacterium]|jgi:hypothetical protein|nr:hypothetical protein [Flavobacteriaceae bacterium]